MQSRPWSTGKLNKLGACLAAGSDVPEGVPSYSEVMRWYNDHTSSALDVVKREAWRESLGGRSYKLSSRTKTIDTLVQKLQRNPKMMLARVDDISGVRLEMDMTMDEQDEVVRSVAAAFDSEAPKPCKIRDMRQADHQGYRAVHVIAYPGAPVEVQIRTTLQSEWANVYETFGDLHGRAVRYSTGTQSERVERVASMLREVSLRFVADLEELANQLAGIDTQVQVARTRLASGGYVLTGEQREEFSSNLDGIEIAREKIRLKHSAAEAKVLSNMRDLHELIRASNFEAIEHAEEEIWSAS